MCVWLRARPHVCVRGCVCAAAHSWVCVGVCVWLRSMDREGAVRKALELAQLHSWRPLSTALGLGKEPPPRVL